VVADELHDSIRLAPLPLIAARMRRARRELELSHDAIARRMGEGATRQHLIKLEKAQHRPTVDTLSRYAEATGRQVEWFLDPDIDPSPFDNGTPS
jgi:transcriptional regulator with XRE-family HTH domain